MPGRYPQCSHSVKCDWCGMDVYYEEGDPQFHLARHKTDKNVYLEWLHKPHIEKIRKAFEEVTTA